PVRRAAQERHPYEPPERLDRQYPAGAVERRSGRRPRRTGLGHLRRTQHPCDEPHPASASSTTDITRMVGVWRTRPRVVGTGVMPRVGALVSLLEQLADTRRDAGNHLYGDDGEDRQDDQRDHHTTDG